MPVSGVEVAIDLECESVPGHFPTPDNSEICAICMSVSNNGKYVESFRFTKGEAFKTEKQLLDVFMRVFNELDPNIVVSREFDFGWLAKRCPELKLRMHTHRSVIMAIIPGRTVIVDASVNKR